MSQYEKITSVEIGPPHDVAKCQKEMLTEGKPKELDENQLYIRNLQTLDQLYNVFT